MASKAALGAAAQVVVLAGDTAAFTEEINTMRLGPITYELLVFSHDAIMSHIGLMAQNTLARTSFLMPAGAAGSSCGAPYEAMQVSTALLVRPIRSSAPTFSGLPGR